MAGSRKGIPNKKTGSLMLVYEFCADKGYHPAETLIEIAQNKEVDAAARVKAASELISYFEGKQPESRPHTPHTPEQSVEAVKAVMQELEQASKPIEPNPGIPVA